MTYVVTDACIKCKYMDCVEVCPVDCFYEGEVMLVINPNECIDCGVCEPECPAEAILPDTESGLEKWLELNTNFSAQWPNITRKKDSPPAGAVRGQYHRIAFTTRGSYLYVDLIPRSGKMDFDVGPIIGARFNSRRHTGDPIVKLLPRRKTAIEVGGFAGMSFHGLTNPYD